MLTFFKYLFIIIKHIKMTVSTLFKRGASIANQLGRKWSSGAVSHLGQKMKHNMSVIGRKAAGSLRTISEVGTSVLPTVRAIADVSGNPVAGYAAEGIRRGINALNDMRGRVEHVRNTLR